MHSVWVLSPHLDDAVFSLGCWLRRWTELDLSISVLNFYTVSSYAPWVSSPAAIAARRRYEDRQALRAVSPQIAVTNLDLLDAPLRLGSAVSAVMQQDVAAVRQVDVDHLQAHLRPIRSPSLVVAPLGLGGHIDHLTVREAARRSLPEHLLAFYEDLPYAAWASLDEVEAQIGAVNQASLQRVTLHGSSTRFEKRRWVACYRSQLKREDALLIARYKSEGLWTPRTAARELRQMASPPRSNF